MTTPPVEVPTNADRTLAGETGRRLCKYNATTPATCGDAIEVPDAVAIIKSSPIHPDGIPTPAQTNPSPAQAAVYYIGQFFFFNLAKSSKR
jgi:hypothetical protein